MVGDWISWFEIASERRRILRRHFDIGDMSERLEESCVPSYCHKNWAAAWAAWLRLMVASRLWKRHAPNGAVLDFGAATGELFHFLGPVSAYHFIDEDDLLAESLATFVPGAEREVLDRLAPDRFGAIFALDSLEHNEDVPGLLDRLLPALKEGGVLILSGPTENLLYRLGRSVAGFSAHYHKTTIHEIEQWVGARRFLCLERRRVPLGVPLFNVSAWTAG
jgi:hypothetical protein